MDSPQTLKSPQRFPSLDGIRGIAVLAVILFHCFPLMARTSIDSVVAILRSPLWIGVDLFFVLSGFLITGILLDTKKHPAFFKNFFVRRSLRILPLYYGVLVFLFVLLPLLAYLIGGPFSRLVEGNYLKELSSKQIWLWTYMHNFLQAYGPRQLPGLGHFWSLAIEEQFYLFWPFVVYALGTRSLSRTCLAICLIVGILRPLLLSWGFTPWAVRELTFTRVDTLVYGALFALSIRNETITQLLLKYRWILIGLTAFVIVVLGVVSRDFKGEGYWMQVVGYPAVAFASGLFIFYSSVSDIQNQSNRLLARGLLPNLGLYSYGLYVFHYPIVQAVRNLVETMHLERYFQSVAFIRLVEFLIIMPASYAIALASFWLYERHWLKLKNYFDYYNRKEVANS